MLNRVRGRWIANVMVGLAMLVGVQVSAFAYPQARAEDATAAAVQVATGFVMTSTVAVPPSPMLLRGPHLAARMDRQAHGGLGAPLPPIGPLQMTSEERHHFISGTTLTIVSAVLLANFLWMAIYGGVWFFAFYLPVAEESNYFPPSAALFFISFAFLIPGLILLPLGLKELKIYRAMESAEWFDGPGVPDTAIRPGGVTLLRF
jgi:hypothetical protein